MRRVPVSAKGGAKFEVSVTHNFGSPNLDLLEFLQNLDDKLRRGTIRKMVAASGTQLAKEIRKQLKSRTMQYSRYRNAAERRKARKQGTKPLALTIKTKTWSKPRRGIIGCVVGPAWPQGAHGHLAEFGHRITGSARVKFDGISIKALLRGKLKRKTVRIGRRSIARAGDRTVAHHFQEEAMDRAEWDMYQAMFKAMSKALAKAGNPHIIKRGGKWQL